MTTYIQTGGNMDMNILDQLNDLGMPNVEQKEWMKSVSMELGTKDNLKRIEQECVDAKVYGIDLETSGLDQRAYKQGNGHLVTNDKIVGVCLAPSTTKGYYIPLRHKEGTNVPPRLVMEMLERIQQGGASGVFHNAKFDLKFLQCEPSHPMDWDKISTWEDTFVLAYLRNPKDKQKGLKRLAKKELDREMLELTELFHVDHIKAKKNLDFSMLDPSWEPVVWYAAADAINTLALYHILYPTVVDRDEYGKSQKTVYQIEKLCVLATMYMEQCRIHIDKSKVRELIETGQAEWWQCVQDVYLGAQELLDRDIRPNWVKMFSERFDPKDLTTDYMKVREECDKSTPPDVGVEEKSVPKLTNPRELETVSFPNVYDILKPQDLGKMLRELGVQGLNVTEKSGQIKTSKDELERVIEDAGETYPFMAKIKRFREVSKALGTNLFNIWRDVQEDRSPDGTVWANFSGHKVDTGRFSTPTPRKGRPFHGQVNWNVQSTPANYDKSKPQCVWRMRECISARPNHLLFAIDFSGVELRIVTNMSGESKWTNEFFRCSTCENKFPRTERPPMFCPECGSDKIGDLHSLTALSIYGDGIKGTKEFKLRRQTGKIVNFLLCYGGGGGAVSRSTGVDKEEGWRIKRQFDKAYKGLIKWWGSTHNIARQQFYVTTAFGRKYPVPDINHEEGGWRSKAERNAVNAPVQGSSADIMKLAMGLLYKEFKARGWDYRVLMNITIHDELVFEIPYELCSEAVDVIDNIMCFKTVQNLGWTVPLKCDVEFGDDWSVPYNLTEMMWNKGGGDWDGRLAKVFPKKYQHYLEQGGKPISVDVEPPKKEEPVGTGTKAETVSTSTPTPKSTSVNKEHRVDVMSNGAEHTYVIHQPNMTPDGAERLAQVISKCLGKGLDELRIVDSLGNDLLGKKIRVALEQFKIIAQYEGI